MSGFFLMHRGWRDNPIFKGEFSRADAWVWLIEHACWQPSRVRIKGETVTLDRGELSFSVRFLADTWGWSKSRVDRFLSDLRDEDMIETRTKIGTTTDHKAGQGQSIITICNYAKYQDQGGADRDNVGTDTGTTAGQQRDNSGTNKNKGTREQREPDGSHTPQSPPAEKSKAPDAGKTTAPAKRRTPAKKPIAVCDRPDDVSDQVWTDFISHRDRLEADVSETVIVVFRREADRVGWSLEQALMESIMRGWRGFRARWIENDEQRYQDNRAGGGQHHGGRSGTSGKSALNRAIDDGFASLGT
ncbi:hypothetical protein F1640_18415 [Novosphingobium sp. NBM11]|uniref:hypothetical protein n=1 Tax=Novosphingobium sp. NBM11 TaxID=2596914 RepID=UPI0018921469|nr:hypothetical protein [Novosphingobium sp. NBM11]MBF5091930.1 hypothetical protein [Novosphingobium sp. NBM11]